MILFSCKDASRTMSAQRDRPLSFFERVSLTGHLLVCAACRLYRRQIAVLDRWCRGAGAAEEASAASINEKTTDGLTPESRERLRLSIAKAAGDTQP
ncbi:MAG: hypothetical protein NTW19_02990 [Planctomycetota bacterium]|nr:hypothetical protein [Planctomycetota bacterium]